MAQFCYQTQICRILKRTKIQKQNKLQDFQASGTFQDISSFIHLLLDSQEYALVFSAQDGTKIRQFEIIFPIYKDRGRVFLRLKTIWAVLTILRHYFKFVKVYCPNIKILQVQLFNRLRQVLKGIRIYCNGKNSK